MLGKIIVLALTSVAPLVGHHLAKRKVACSIPMRARAWAAGQSLVGACVRGH